MIEKEKIEAIKNGVDLVALVESKGISLKKNGKSWFGLCPFHDDTDPSLSVNPTNNLWKCFGCGAGGDVIRFVELFDQVDFKEAVNRLSVNSCQLPVKNKSRNRPNTKNKTTGLTAKLFKLLNRVIEFYHTAFCEDPRAKEYLINRGITDNAVFADFKIGFANGTLLNTLPGDGDIFEQLKQIGVLTGKGNEHFYGYMTFPLYDHNGNPAGIYGRRIDDLISGNVPDHLYLPGKRHGLFNRQAAKAHKEIILTESIIDSLTLINAGIRNTIPCFGINGLTHNHLTLFKQSGVETVYICLDADEPGTKAVREISKTLQTQGIQTFTVNLPDTQDINDFFLLTANPTDRFKELLNQANPDAYPAVKEEK